MSKNINHLKMGGANWVNLWIAESATRQVVESVSKKAGLGLTAIEVCMLAVLFKQDGGMKASVLAAKLGRAATSFTPNIDKLAAKGFIERRPDAGGDRRAVNLHATDKAVKHKADILGALEDAEETIRRQIGVTADEWTAFQRVLAGMQSVEFAL
jgi:DNA-binding MarR family transcriptional regulator